jgi:hypothetical protein
MNRYKKDTLNQKGRTMKSDLIPTTTNCNYWLSRFYKDIEDIGRKIDKAIIEDNKSDYEKYNNEFEETYDIQSKFLEFRSNHNCLIEGDEGYGPR